MDARADLQFVGGYEQFFQRRMEERFTPDNLQKLRAHHAAQGDEIFAERHRIGKPLFKNGREGAAVITAQIAVISNVIFESPGLYPAVYDRIVHYPFSIWRTVSMPLVSAAR